MDTPDFLLVESSIEAGMLWGAAVGGLYRWVSRGLPDANAKSLKWAAWTALVIAVGFFFVHAN